MKQPKWGALVQFVKFGIVGVGNTLIYLAVYYVLIWIDKELYLVGNVVGWIVSVTNSYYWNNKYVFCSETESLMVFVKKFGKFLLSNGAVFLLTTGLIFLQVQVMDWPEETAPIVNLLITIPLNFALNKFWTYR